MRGIQYILLLASVLIGGGLLILIYTATDPNPWWWEANYPWYRLAVYGLLLAGALSIVVGLTSIYLENRISAEELSTTRSWWADLMAYESTAFLVFVVLVTIIFAVLHVRTNNQIEALRAELELLKTQLSS